MENYEVSHINFTHKSFDSCSVAYSASLARENFPDQQLTQNVSMKYIRTKEALCEFIQTISYAGIDSFLFVSGSPRKKFDSVEALRSIPKGKHVSVAYTINEDLRQREEENQRFKRKLSIQKPETVYLQICDNEYELVKTIHYLQTILPGVKIALSLLLPTPSLLTSLRKKLWTGVCLSDDYLKNIAFAQEKTCTLYEFCKKNEVEPVFECFQVCEYPDEYEAMFNMLEKRVGEF